MQSIKIDLGTIQLAVNDDPERIIEFNPQDIGFAERFYTLLSEFDVKSREFYERAEKIEKNDVENGLGLMREMCEYMREKIDQVFGEGSSQKAFGNAMTLNMFEQFFAGVTPYIQKARTEKVKQYTNRAQKRAALK